MSANLRTTKNEMPVQDPNIRNSNFLEVSLGYSEEQAIDEAKRCLNCKNKPCVEHCPVNIDIPTFIGCIAGGEFEKAYQIITEHNSLPAICGRVCPQESQCEGKCARGIKGESVGIGRLERFAADYHNAHSPTSDAVKFSPTKTKKVAVVGSGPSGLSCAGNLAKKGYSVTIFEALHREGGVMIYGIPEFRLPKAIVQHEIQGLKNMGVEIVCNTIIGKTLTVDELLNEHGYSAVYIGSGAGLPRFMHIPGEDLNGVFAANDFLTRINLMKAYMEGSSTPIQHAKKTAVIGGGNVAMDSARCAKRLGSDVTVIYRRTEKELPARAEEVKNAKEEGIHFMFLTEPVKIAGDERGWVKMLVCEKMALGKPDASGRAESIPIPGSEIDIDVDCVIMAIGTSPNPLIRNSTKGLDTQKWGGIIIDEATGQTSRKGVYAGGDAVTGAATVILAMGEGKKAAAAIDAYLQ
ncbi:glutamate synthase [Treponema sp. R8-4-B8]